MNITDVMGGLWVVTLFFQFRASAIHTICTTRREIYCWAAISRRDAPLKPFHARSRGSADAGKAPWHCHAPRLTEAQWNSEL